RDGVYQGNIRIDYEMTVPLVGGSSVCNGTVNLTVDSTQADPVAGNIACDWPPLDLWATITLNRVTGTLTGDTNGLLLDGRTNGRDGSGTFVWNEPWSGAASGDTISGSFSGGHFLTDNYSANFTVTRTGP
ncbi:MAG: hypothetical protein H6735_31300, partial [Alphaproteobacteria bacterium]|nr:hypothetical protein [Alphaproteobacteria bacterium]